MIKISKSPTADTRTCDFANVSKETPQSQWIGTDGKTVRSQSVMPNASRRAVSGRLCLLFGISGDPMTREAILLKAKERPLQQALEDKPISRKKLSGELSTL